MSSASAPIWECAVAPNSGSVTGLGFCRLLVRYPQAELPRSVPKMAREDERIGAVTRWLFALVKQRLPPMPVGLGWTRAGTNQSRGLPEQRLAVPQRTDGRLLVAHRMASPRAGTLALDSTEDAACLERIRAVASLDTITRASGLAPVASLINIKTHLGSTTSSRRTRRHLSVAARS